MNREAPVNKILILAANPKATSRLRIDEELREIEEGLLRAKKRDQFVLKTILAVRYRDIHRQIIDFEPQIVHFSGHGEGENGLLFEDVTGQVKLVDAEALAGLFELFADHVKCVVINACYSEVQAKAIAQHIDYVIGMNQAIGDKAAIEFAVGFYDALSAGKTVEFAYKIGCRLIRIAGIPEFLTPKLLTKKKSEKEVDYIYLQKLPTSGERKKTDLVSMEVLLFCSEQDNKLREELETAVSSLQREGIIKIWHEKKIGAGKNIKLEIDKHLN